MRQIFSETSNISHYSLSPDETTSSLDLNWCPMSDSLMFLNNFKQSKAKGELLWITKERVRSVRFPQPCPHKKKGFFQELWQWDDELPSHTLAVACLQRINLYKLEIPIFIIPKIDSQGRIELHGFCDALQIAFYACTFLRQLTGAGT